MPELNIASCDWNAYITLLRQQDALWARHRDNISLSSYLRCLEDARAVLSLPSWDELSHREATILLGLGTQYGPHGLLGSLRGAGIGLSLDDFGMGYSSLAMLHAFGFDTIKLDRAFLAPGQDKQRSVWIIISSLVDMARRLGIEILCEGVETEDQLQKLLASHCKYGQGYLYTPPMNLETIDAYVDAELSNFDITPDLSMKVEPTVINNQIRNPSNRSVGLQCSFRFKKQIKQIYP